MKLAIILLSTAVICSGATIIGAGSDISTTTTDNSGGDRLNVHQVATSLTAGTYTVSNWSLNVITHTAGIGSAGTITPMLLIGAPSNYTTLWLGSAIDPSANGVQVINESGNFTLTEDTDIYAGFFTENQGSDIIGIALSGGPISHDSSFTAPTGVDQTVDGFSNPTLNRQYAFEITVVPEPSSSVLLFLSTIPLFMRRRR